MHAERALVVLRLGSTDAAECLLAIRVGDAPPRVGTRVLRALLVADGPRDVGARARVSRVIVRRIDDREIRWKLVEGPVDAERLDRVPREIAESRLLGRG